jgi:hypothetical protein
MPTIDKVKKFSVSEAKRKPETQTFGVKFLMAMVVPFRVALPLLSDDAGFHRLLE